MPYADANGIRLCYETMGHPEGDPLLLVMGLGAQLISWPEELCELFVAAGFHVIRFDNRDVGLSSYIEGGEGEFMPAYTSAVRGEDVEVPYRLTDMAADAVGLLDALGIASAHVVGASMGGMIAQTIAIEHPERVRSLTSIMSTTGETDVGQPTPEALQALLRPPPTDRASAIEAGVASSRVIGSPDDFDEAEAASKAARAYDRAFHPAGTARQLLAIVASGSRAEGLRALEVPTLVVHGDADPLVTPSGGIRTAELVPGATLVLIEGMGHDLAPRFWPRIVDVVAEHARRPSTVS